MPAKAIDDVHDTQHKYKYENVSLGAAGQATFEGQDIMFAEGVAIKAQQFDARNLIYCKYLNLRNSSFNNVDT